MLYCIMHSELTWYQKVKHRILKKTKTKMNPSTNVSITFVVETFHEKALF